MSFASCRVALPTEEPLPPEMVELVERIQNLAPEVREELEPFVYEVLEHAMFRGRILSVAKDALERLRLDLDMALFDLDATRRERESLRELLERR